MLKLIKLLSVSNLYVGSPPPHLCGANSLKPIEQLKFKTVLIPNISDQGLPACMTFQPILASLVSLWLLKVEILQNGLVK